MVSKHYQPVLSLQQELGDPSIGFFRGSKLNVPNHTPSSVCLLLHDGSSKSLLEVGELTLVGPIETTFAA